MDAVTQTLNGSAPALLNASTTPLLFDATPTTPTQPTPTSLTIPELRALIFEYAAFIQMVTLLVILAIIVLARLIVDWGFADGLFALFCPPLPVVLRYGLWSSEFLISLGYLLIAGTGLLGASHGYWGYIICGLLCALSYSLSLLQSWRAILTDPGFTNPSRPHRKGLNGGFFAKKVNVEDMSTGAMRVFLEDLQTYGDGHSVLTEFENAVYRAYDRRMDEEEEVIERAIEEEQRAKEERHRAREERRRVPSKTRGVRTPRRQQV